MSENAMKLPEGKTCADCAYYKRCYALFECPSTNTECDWAPSRFRQRVISLSDEEQLKELAANALRTYVQPV